MESVRMGWLALMGMLLLAGICRGQEIETAVLGEPQKWVLPPAEPVRLQLLKDDAGQSMFVSAANGVTITSAQAMEGDVEVIARLRLARPKDRGINCTLTVGGIALVLSAQASPATQIHWSFSSPGDPKAHRSGAYEVKRLPPSMAGWPALAATRIENVLSVMPTLDEKWLTLRIVMRGDRAEAYVEDRFVAEFAGSSVRSDGMVKLAMSENVQLASLRAAPALPAETRFHPVALEGYVNKANLTAHALADDALPRGQIMTLGGVPLLPPRPRDAKDHIDVGRSWVAAGLIEGGHDGWEGFTARWSPASSVDPSRIKLSIPNRRFARMHLLAAYDGEPDSVPVVTAQFYRPSAGHPLNFAARVPLFTAPASQATAVPVTLADGSQGHLFLVTIPLEPEGLAAFSDLDHLEFELTKETRIYRAFPDPCYYSQHGGGLPSGVHVYAITLERPPVEADLQPDQFAHIWTSPQKPSYSVNLHNNTDSEQEVHLELSTVSHDGTETTSQQQSVRVPPGGQQTAKISLDLKRFGYHDVKLVVKDEQGERTQTRSLAHLHPDTRERGQWEEGKGPLWGMWDWNGSHGTPSGAPRFQVALAAGIESSMRPLVPSRGENDDLAFAEKNGMVTHFLAYQFGPAGIPGIEWDPSKPEAMKKTIIETIKSSPLSTPTALNKPELAVFFGEPLIGPVSYMSFPEYYGEPPYQMTEAEQKKYQHFLDQFVIAASAIKSQWPDAKCLLAWGISSFPIPFLRHSPEATALMDGPAVDQILFERLPEMQMHQVTFASTLWQFKQEWIKAGKPWPIKLISIEGGGLPSPATPGAVTQQQEADHSVRGELILEAYGVTRHLGWPSLFRCSGAWGEQHYGGGLCERIPLLSPKVAYSAHATMTRQLNRMNYSKTIETGSASVFCMQFKHYSSGELLHVLWTLRGTRPVTFATADAITAQDSMDNPMPTAPLVLSTSPCYVRGLKDDAKITLGEADHSDAAPAPLSQRVASLGDGSWTISEARDEDYENAHLEFIRRFPAKMTTAPASAPEPAGGKALAVHLLPPDKERKTMPFYTTLLPSQPIALMGKPSHLGLWVNASSDWGRFVYFLRDANGERWISIGKSGEWNVDDVHCWSAFNFDGWRYLRFEMPGNQPWDCYRDAGTSFWGYYGQGDGIVDLPLTLEKIVVERRTHVIKVDELIPADPADVLLADLYAEYESAPDQTDEAIRLSRLRMSSEATTPAPAKKDGDMGTPFK